MKLQREGRRGLDPKSPSVRRAWIEIIVKLAKYIADIVALREEGVD